MYVEVLYISALVTVGVAVAGCLLGAVLLGVAWLFQDKKRKKR